MEDTLEIFEFPKMDFDFEIPDMNFESTSMDFKFCDF